MCEVTPRVLGRLNSKNWNALYARQHGMTVDPEFVFREEAAAGDHWSDRPAYSALLLDAMRGNFSALVVSNTDVLESDPDTVKELSKKLF